MNQRTPDAPISFFKTQKGFEGKSAFYCWHCSFKDNQTSRNFAKAYLIADAEQQTFGVTLSETKPENLNPSGGVVAQLRKHAKSPTIGRIFKSTFNGDWWLELFLTPQPKPDFWVRLQASKPPELSLIDKNKVIYIRKSSQGTFTKKKQFDGDLPDLEMQHTFQIMNSVLIKEFLTTKKHSEMDQSLEDSTAVYMPILEKQILPDFQREARDRLARRLKTLRKSDAKIPSPNSLREELEKTEKEADLIKAWLHLIKEGDDILDLSFLPATESHIRCINIDPEKTPGGNLESFFQKLKKLKKAATISYKLHQDILQEIHSMEEDLLRLRNERLDLKATEQILLRYKIAAKKEPVKKDSLHQHTPWRTFTFDDNGRPVAFFIGKSAADNDDLCKKARSNDTWMHAVGVTGSHVIIPAKTAGQNPNPDLVKTAGILALHFSKLRDDLRGEVYISKRQHIRKQKSMPPGLWSVDKADSIFIKYDQSELQKALNLGAP